MSTWPHMSPLGLHVLAGPILSARAHTRIHTYSHMNARAHAHTHVHTSTQKHIGTRTLPPPPHTRTQTYTDTHLLVHARTHAPTHQARVISRPLKVPHCCVGTRQHGGSDPGHQRGAGHHRVGSRGHLLHLPGRALLRGLHRHHPVLLHRHRAGQCSHCLTACFVPSFTASQPASSRFSLPHSLLRPVFHCLTACFVPSFTASQPVSSRLSLPHSLFRPVFHCLTACFIQSFTASQPASSSLSLPAGSVPLYAAIGCSMFQYRVSF